MSLPTSGPPPLRRLIVPGFFVAALIAAVFLRQGPSEKEARELAVSGPTMGTTFNVKVVTDDLSDAHRERVAAHVRDMVERVDNALEGFLRG